MKNLSIHTGLLPLFVGACFGCVEPSDSSKATPTVETQLASGKKSVVATESTSTRTTEKRTLPDGPIANSPYTAFKQFADGTSNTLLGGTVAESQAVPWTKPEDVRFDDSFLTKENTFAEGYFIFADGSIRHIAIREGLNHAKFRALFTIKGGESDATFPFKGLYPEGYEINFSEPDNLQDHLRLTKARMTISNSLKRIALAFHNYHSAFKHLPPAVVYGPDGKPWHSWRVLILPFLEQIDLYKEYDQSVPWDDPKNASVLEKMPQLYRDPLSDDANPTRTRYLVITGSGTAFPTRTVIPTTYAEELKTAETKPSSQAENPDALKDKEKTDGSSITRTETEAIEEIKKLGGTVFQIPSTNETSVVFAMSKVNDDGLVHLASVKNISSLTLTSNIVTDKGLTHLEGLAGLKKLILSGTNFSDSGLVHLRGLTNLESIHLGGPRFTNTGLVHIQQFSKLKSLGLSMTTVTDSGLQAISKMNQLQSLALMGGFTDAGLVHLNELENLQTLMLTGNKLNGAGLLHLKNLKSLQSLMLGGTRIDDAGLAHLSGLTDLRMLSLDKTSITDTGLLHLSGLKTLTSLSLQKTAISDAGLDYLLEMSKLESLFLSGTSVTEQGKSKLKQTNTNLKIY